MNKSSLYLSLLALVVSAVAIVMAAKRSEQPMAAASINSNELSNVLNENPQIIVDALQRYEQAQREAQAKEAARLFVENWEEISNSPTSPFVGPEDAKVVLVEFFDFSCGYCKRLAPTMEKIVEANPDIKVVFKPLTFMAPVSKYAAQAVIAAQNQGKFMELYGPMLEHQGLLTEEKVDEYASKAGLDMDKYEADLAAEETNAAIQSIASLSQKVQVHGVPTLVLNGTPLQTIDPEGIQAAIDALK